METNNEILRVEDLSVSFHTEDGIVRAVSNVSFSVAPGETLGLVGETGAGKTTIAKAILGVLPVPPARVDSGKVIFEGENLLEKTEKQLRSLRGGKISMIFQDPMTALNPVESVGSQIVETIRLHEKITRLEAWRKAGELLQMVGIDPDRIDEYPHQFSGGMKQRVVIAMALSCNPVLLLADEPTTALDVTIQAQVLDLMQKLREQFASSMILITHELGVVAHNCDRVGIVYAGQIMEIGTVEQVFDRPRHPYTVGLFGCVPNLNMKEKRLHPIPGLMPDPANLPPGCPFSARCPRVTDACRQGTVPQVQVEPGHQVRCLLAAGERSEGNG